MGPDRRNLPDYAHTWIEARPNNLLEWVSYPCREVRCKPETVGPDGRILPDYANARGEAQPDNLLEWVSHLCREVRCGTEAVGSDRRNLPRDARTRHITETNEKCPTMPTHGAKRNPTTCWNGSVIHAEKFDVALKRWVPTGETPPPKPECSPGDKKTGYVCEDGKWIPYTPPEPVVVPETEVPPTHLPIEEAVARHETGLPCYVKCTLPVLSTLPGLPWSPEMWIPPFCVLTTEP
jgi:hypothetical protein